MANADVVDYAMADYVLLQEKEEHALLLHMAGFSQAITKAAQEFRPNVIARYVLELSHAFNAFYQKHKVLVEDQKLMHTRLLLVAATRQILANGLVLLGIDAPEVM